MAKILHIKGERVDFIGKKKSESIWDIVLGVTTKLVFGLYISVLLISACYLSKISPTQTYPPFRIKLL